MGRNDKAASASAAHPLQNLPLNDDSWQAFVFSVHEDPSQQETSRIGALAATVASGIRQRFSVLSRSSLLSWAIENHKGYDLCKEAKALIDASSGDADLSNSLVARLLKLRLIVLKQQALDSKNEQKANGSPDTPSVSEAIDTAKLKAKSKEDKDSARAKSPPKKTTKGSLPKPADAASRPESAQSLGDVSKRKVRLRDKGVVKLDANINSIGDEPLGGPDAYYLLQDFDDVGFFISLMEEVGVQVEIAIFLSHQELPQGNTLVHQLRARALSASDRTPSMWQQFAWSILKTGNREDGEIFDDVSKAVYTHIDKKKVHQAFYSQTEIVVVPAVHEESLEITTRCFRRTLDRVERKQLLKPDVILAALLDHASRTRESDNNRPFSPPGGDVESLKVHLRKLVTRLSILPHEVTRSGNDDFPSPDVELYGDWIGQAKVLLGNAMGDSRALREALEELGNAYPMRKFLGLLPNLTETAQQVVPSEVRQEMQIDPSDEGARCWIEDHDCNSISQILQCARLRWPHISFQRLESEEKEGLILLCMSGPGDFEAITAEVEHDFHATTKVGLGLFTELHNGAPEVLGTAGVNDSERAYVYSCGDQLFQFNETYTYMYPNTGGQIRVLRRELKGRDGNIEWLGRIIDQDAVFSWGRKAMDISESRLTGTYDDGTVIVATFKGAAGVTLELSTATGLHITWGNEGIISQRYVTYINERVSSSHSAARPRHEVLRETLRDATTIVYLSDGSVEVLYPNGNTAIRDFSGRWSSTNATGVKHSASPTNDGIASSSVQVVQLKDDVAHKTVISRADLVTVSFEANQCITEHSDGTTFIQHGLNNIDRRDVRTEIKHKEFASVHLCGDRSSITVDSANVTVEFENDGPSGVISRIIKGQHMIELSGSGVATIRCLPIGDAQSDRSSATLGRGGSYRVNYCTGELEARDWKGNKFSIGENGITELEQVESACESTESENTIIHPLLPSLEDVIETTPAGNTPRVFLMKENGDGQEFLRDVDVLAVLKSSTFHVNGLSHGRPVLGVTLSVYEPALDRRTYRRLLRHCNKSDILNSGFEKQTVGLEHADVHNANPPQQRPMIEIASGNGKAAGGFQRNRWTKEQRIRYGEPASVGKLKVGGHAEPLPRYFNRPEGQLLLQKLLPLSDSRPHPASQTQLPTIPLKQISEDTTVAPTISQIEPALEKEEDNVQLVFSTGTKDHISPHHSLVIKPSVLRFTPNEPSQKFVLQNVTSRPIRYKIKQIRGGNFEITYQPGPIAPGVQTTISARAMNANVKAEDHIQVQTPNEIITIPCIYTI